MPTIISIGSAVKDVFLVPSGFKLLTSREFEGDVGLCFAQGGKFEVDEIYYDTGGGATNVAATFRNLGISCACCTKVGKDEVGDEIIQDLKKRGVDTKFITRHHILKTGYSTVLISPTGDRSILVYRGASSDFNPKDITTALRAQWFYVTTAKGKMDFVDKVFSVAKKNKTKVFWNPGKGELQKGFRTLEPYIAQTAILSVNKEEAEMLVGKKSIQVLLARLSSLAEKVLITDGKKGAYYASRDEYFFIPSLGTKALNATGAGDAFGSGFLAGYVLTQDWKKAAKIAVLNADGVIQEMGAKHGLLEKIPSTQKMNMIKITPLS